jgi:hypothetical protein
MSPDQYEEIPQNYEPLPPQQLDPLALVSFVLALIAAPMSLCLGLIGWGIVLLPNTICSMVFGIISLFRCYGDPGRFRGKVFAIVGLVLSGVSTAFVVGMFIFYIFLLKNDPNFHRMLDMMMKVQPQ